jgi:hypothetical protein
MQTPGTTAGALWRRAVEALAHAFDPAREGDDEETVFQTRRQPAQPSARRERAPTSPPAGKPAKAPPR